MTLTGKSLTCTQVSPAQANIHTPSYKAELHTRLSFSHTVVGESHTQTHTHTSHKQHTRHSIESLRYACPAFQVHPYTCGDLKHYVGESHMCTSSHPHTRVRACTHTHTVSRSGSLPCSKSHIHVCLGFIHTHPHQCSYTYRQVYITYV